MNLKHLLLALIFSLISFSPAVAQDVTSEVEPTVVMTVPAEVVPTAIADEPDVVINNGGETPAVPSEPAPWWAALAANVAIAFAAIWGVIKAVRIAAEAFVARPQQVALAEAGYGSVVPTPLRPGIRRGVLGVLDDLEAGIKAIRRAADEVTDDEPVLGKQSSAQTKQLPNLPE